MKKKNVKQNDDKSLKYYKDTLEKNEVVSDVIGLKEFVKQFKRYNPHIDKIVNNGWYQPNIPHECSGNTLFLATILLPNGFHYVEGVILDDDNLFHHAFLFSRSIKCFVDPTLDPKDFKYYVSDKVHDIERLYSLLKYDKEYDVFSPSWINEDIISKARIRERRKDESS